MTPVQGDMKEPNWKEIAFEVWNLLDDVGLFLESEINRHEGRVMYPFLEKKLPERFKHFRFYHGRTMHISEYEKEKALSDMQVNQLRDLMLKPKK